VGGRHHFWGPPYCLLGLAGLDTHVDSGSIGRYRYWDGKKRGHYGSWPQCRGGV
jgi:hypothetical protein